MTTPLATDELPWLTDNASVIEANRLLAPLVAGLTPLPLRDAAIIPRVIHFASGPHPAGFHAPPHQHSELQLEYVYRGHVRFTMGTAEASLEAGDWLALAPAVEHAWIAIRTSLMMGVHLELSGPRSAELATWLRAQVAITTRPADAAVRLGLHHEAQALLTLLGGPATPWRSEQLINRLRQFIILSLHDIAPWGDWLPQNTAPTRTAEGTRSRQVYELALAFLQANYARDLRVGDVADQVGVTSRHLERLFTRHGGQPLVQALIAERLTHAQALLTSTPPLPVKEIAWRCGFRSPAYFAACYRRAYGHSPTSGRSR